MEAGAAAWNKVFEWGVRTAEAVIKGLLALVGTCLGGIAAAREYQTLTAFFFEFAAAVSQALAASVIIWFGLVVVRSSISGMFTAERREWFARHEAKKPWLGRIVDAGPHVMLASIMAMLCLNLGPVAYPVWWFGHNWRDGRDATICETRWRTAPDADLSVRCAALRKRIDGRVGEAAG